MELGEHPWTATLFYWIGLSYMTLAKDKKRGDYVDKAKTKLEKALEVQTKLLGDHLDTARSHVCLGDALRIQGTFRLAMGELVKGLKIREKVLGPDHELTMAARKEKEELQRLCEESRPRKSLFLSGYPNTKKVLENTVMDSGDNGVNLTNFNEGFE